MGSLADDFCPFAKIESVISKDITKKIWLCFHFPLVGLFVLLGSLIRSK